MDQLLPRTSGQYTFSSVFSLLMDVTLARGLKCPPRTLVRFPSLIRHGDEAQHAIWCRSMLGILREYRRQTVRCTFTRKLRAVSRCNRVATSLSNLSSEYLSSANDAVEVFSSIVAVRRVTKTVSGANHRWLRRSASQRLRPECLDKSYYNGP